MLAPLSPSPSPPPAPPPASPSPPPSSPLPPLAPAATVVNRTTFLSTDPSNPTLIGPGWSDAREVTLLSGYLGGKWVQGGCKADQCGQTGGTLEAWDVVRKTVDSHVATADS